MVDNRSSGALGISGSFNFKSGDASGSANKMSDEKMGQGSEYAMLTGEQEEMRPDEPFVDRSAQLKATLNSLAMVNVAGILKNIKRTKSNQNNDGTDLLVEEISDDEDSQNNKNEKK